MSINKYHNWWINDYNPLDGRLRCLFYLLLFYLAYNSVLPNAINRLEACPESFFEANGLMQLFIPAGISGPEIAAFLFYARYVIMFFWICAAIGLFGRISSLATGIGIFVFWGSMQSCAGTGHDWYLPMYSLLFLGIFSKYDKWSADYWLSTKFQWYPFNDFSPNRYGGLARKLILLTAVFILFAGGIAKLFTGGFEWLNGESLYFYLKEFNQPSHFIGPLLLDFLLEHKWIITFLAVWTVILELGSVVVLFKKNWRLFFVINLWAFHIGIYLLMFPRYFPSMVCYFLIVNWRYTYKQLYRSYGQYVKKVPLFNRVSQIISKEPSETVRPAKTAAVQRVIFPSVLSVLFIVTILLRIETFPLTYVPMYSTILTEEKIGNYKRADFNNRDSLFKIAERYANGDQPRYIRFYYPRKIEIRMWYRESVDSEIKTKDVTDEYIGLIRNWAKWNQVITEVTLSEISEDKLFTENPGNISSKTKNILNETKSILSSRGGYDYIDKVALIYHFDEGDEEMMTQVK